MCIVHVECRGMKTRQKLSASGMHELQGYLYHKDCEQIHKNTTRKVGKSLQVQMTH